MKSLLALVFFAMVASCGGASEPAGCSLCGTWYSRYQGTPTGRDPNWSLTIRQDASFSELFGSSPGLAGTWLASSTHLTLAYNGVSQQQTGVIVADSITFPTSSVFAARVYAK